MRSTSGKKHIITRLITLPFRALIRARDSYVKRMTDIAERPTFRASASSSSSSSSYLPKSSSVVSRSSSIYESGDDFSELVRAASVRRLGRKLDQELSRRPPAAAPASGVVPRSCSVGMAKIDENMPCEFGVEDGVRVKAESMYPRSKSTYAFALRTAVVL